MINSQLQVVSYCSQTKLVIRDIFEKLASLLHSKSTPHVKEARLKAEESIQWCQ